jgi:hypothetical protein
MRSPELDAVVVEFEREDRIRRGAAARNAGGRRRPRAAPSVPTAEPDDEMLDTEQELQRLKERFDQTGDPRAREELAVSALEHVEGQLRLTRTRRHALDAIEGRLWTRRNRIERFLIQTKGREWWHARGDAARGSV